MQSSPPYHLRASTSSLSSLDDMCSAKEWALSALQECARAISDNDSAKMHHLLWMLNEFGSPYGDVEERLASHFLQALFSKATDLGDSRHNMLVSLAHKNHSFDTMKRVILKFQEVSPWTTFGHVSSNGAILETLEGEPKIHIVDISNTYCTQWPTFLEALASRDGEVPHVRLTVVAMEIMEGSTVKEMSRRMKRFARLMRVPFEFNVVSVALELCELKEEEIEIREDEAVAVNCVGTLRRVSIGERSSFIRLLRRLRPRIVTIAEEEADFTNTRGDFVRCFEECLRFYALLFEMLEESFETTSNERLVLERECSRSILGVIACDKGGGGECERREKGSQWSARLEECFSPTKFSDDVEDDVRALSRRCRAGWSVVAAEGCASGLYLAWKGEPVVWASAWKPQNEVSEVSESYRNLM
ncbi:Protein SHORT-ROOT [Ananas comosus]|uniref:Protein SHORT-ROOT n=1 Tax=Ananas comosus TaxID=4615 RepID=A0A199UEF9_ANACO|nr:Protein SHORT-ROOT [Ananas comosus]